MQNTMVRRGGEMASWKKTKLGVREKNEKTDENYILKGLKRP